MKNPKKKLLIIIFIIPIFVLVTLCAVWEAIHSFSYEWMKGLKAFKAEMTGAWRDSNSDQAELLK